MAKPPAPARRAPSCRPGGGTVAPDGTMPEGRLPPLTEADLRRAAPRRNLPPVVIIVFSQDNQGSIVLYELLVRAGYPCHFVYYLRDSERNAAALLAGLRAAGVLFFALSFASQSVAAAFRLAAELRGAFPAAPLIFGGVHPTVDPEGCLDHADAVCVGEGELTMLDLGRRVAAGDDWRGAPNLVFHRAGRVTTGPRAPLLSDLDLLPLRRPYTSDHYAVANGTRQVVTRDLYYRMLPNYRTCYTQTFSRGCPYACAYCGNSVLRRLDPAWGTVRSRSLAATLAEIRWHLDDNPDLIKIFIIDDCFLAHDAAWLREFAAQWRRQIRRELNFFTIPGYVTPEKLALLGDLDCRYCSLGLQSGSPRTNRRYRRAFSRRRFVQAGRDLRAAGIGAVVNVIFDNPWEQDADLLATINTLTRLPKPFYVIQYALKLYPGTELLAEAQRGPRPVPAANLDYENYRIIRGTDLNRLIILAQLLPRAAVAALLLARRHAPGRILLRILHLLACLYLPFHALRVAGSRRWRDNLRLMASHYPLAILWLRGLFGRSAAAGDELAKTTG